MKKIWRIRKQLMAGCLVAVLVLSMIFVPTKKAYAIVGVDDAAFILAMMAAAGIGFVGYNAYNGSNLAEDLIDELGDIEDSVKNAYDKAVFTVLQGGGGGGDDPDNFDPDNDDPEKKPSTWEKLKEWWKKHPNKALSIGATGSVLNAVSRQFGKNVEEKALEGQVNSGVIEIPEELLSTMLSQIQAYPCFVIYKFGSDEYRVVMAADYLYLYNDKPFMSFTASKVYSNWSSSDVNSFSSFKSESSGAYSSKFYLANVPVYPTESDAKKNFSKDKIIYPSAFNPKSVKKTDAAKKAQEDEEKKDKPVYDNVVLPTQEQMNEYINKLDAIAQSDAEPAVKQEQQQQVMNTFVESITNVYPKPDPSLDPNPSPSPDPSPDPDPSPSPDPSPEPDPDAPATDEEAAKYMANLTTIFPFCIPFDLIRAFKVLSVDGEAPVYKIPVQIKYGGYIDINESWDIDMSDFDMVVQIMRIIETLSFIVGLIMITRNLIRG